MKFLGYYLSVINFLTWVTYGLDKGRARSGKWRIPERTLLLLSLAGGSLGALAAMLDLGQGSGPLNHMFDLNGAFADEKE